jgi:hypothetical protein
MGWLDRDEQDAGENGGFGGQGEAINARRNRTV